MHNYRARYDDCGYSRQDNGAPVNMTQPRDNARPVVEPGTAEPKAETDTAVATADRDVASAETAAAATDGAVTSADAAVSAADAAVTSADAAVATADTAATSADAALPAADAASADAAAASAWGGFCLSRRCQNESNHDDPGDEIVFRVHFQLLSKIVIID